ncbi:MAG: R2-like ligand-binding oxidase [Anaerolineae bacterium]|nr:R2-like ligand-binding oxidase [Anaerolineae bacterium]
MIHQEFATTRRGLNRNLPAMRLYEKAKRLGIWNPTDIDLSQDAREWVRLQLEEQDLLLRLTSMFQAGEEAVTLDLLPLIMAVARDGRVEEEIYLTTFLFEEAKHTDFFSRFLQEVAHQHTHGPSADLGRYHTESYRHIFYHTLPQTLLALQDDPSPAALIRASVTYNMVVEGVLAETGYHGYFTVLDQEKLLPGMRQGITLLKQDESRHIAYGVFLISRLLAADDGLWATVEETMNSLLPYALDTIGETFAGYDPIPFGLDPAIFTDFALNQFQKRLERIEKARGASLAEIEQVTHLIIEGDDG